MRHILALFCETHEFTMLHALTTCQALRSLLPYVSDQRKTLSAYWHSVCASYVSVRRMPQFDAARKACRRAERNGRKSLREQLGTTALWFPKPVGPFLIIVTAAFWRRDLMLGLGIVAAGSILKSVWSLVVGRRSGIPAALIGLAMAVASAVVAWWADH
jgi:hypothetical protein